MKRYLHMCWIGIALVLLSGCAALTPAGTIVVSRDSGYTPEGCGPREAAELIVDFLDAQNCGEREHLASFFGDEFMWYSVTQGAPPPNEPRHVAFIARGSNTLVVPGPETYTGSSEQMIERLLDYFAERHGQNQVLRLREVRLTGGSVTSMDLGYSLSINADELDLEEFEVVAVGKGNVDCENRKINVWSMGITVFPSSVEGAPIYGSSCPPAPSPSTLLGHVAGNISDGILACTL